MLAEQPAITVRVSSGASTRVHELIFDEATSSLDAESEEKINKAIEIMKKDRTMLVIAHRLSTVKHCDRILVLDKHTIVEQGTFRDLLKKRGIFYRLYHEQIRGAK